MNEMLKIVETIDVHKPDSRVLEPFTYIESIPGKDFRGNFIDCFQQWLEIPPDKLTIIKEVIRSLHNASLLIDDIEDNSKLRRGVPVAHSIYGVASTINCASYVYFIALDKVVQLNHPDAISIFVQELLNLHRGQGLDILWRDANTCPTEDEYRRMVEDKTGGLFRLAVSLMQVFSSNRSDFRPLVQLLGTYFQIRDDYLNLVSDTFTRSKSYCEDISEGKFSFPIIHAVRAVPSDTRLLHILRMHTEDDAVKLSAIRWMETCGSFTYTKNVLKELMGQLATELDRLGGHAKLSALLSKLDGDLDTLSPPISTAGISVVPDLRISNSTGMVGIEGDQRMLSDSCHTITS